MSELLSCPMCGYRFDPAGHQACAACPLQKGCQLVCCPNCGYELVDPRRSFLARLAERWLRRGDPRGGESLDPGPFFNGR